jgi:RimJ/RimL family protein N-acetyltransferase
MDKNHLSVREIQQEDIEAIINYWLNSDPAFLEGMGVDLKKMPTGEQWKEMLTDQINQPYQEKKSFYTIWLVDGKAIGHCNVNKIIFGQEAFMHLHIWKNENRQKGIGAELVKLSLQWFFKNLNLKNIYCEPYALNPAPNKTLEKLGFEFIKSYTTTPGWINFEQPVNLWELSYEKYNYTLIS